MGFSYVDLPVGTVLRKEFADLGREYFDVFVRMDTGWVLIDQEGIHPHVKPLVGPYDILFEPKVSEG